MAPSVKVLLRVGVHVVPVRFGGVRSFVAYFEKERPKSTRTRPSKKEVKLYDSGEEYRWHSNRAHTKGHS